MNCPSTQYPFRGRESTEKPLLCMPRQNFAGWILDNLSNQSVKVEQSSRKWLHFMKDSMLIDVKIAKWKTFFWHFKASTFWPKKIEQTINKFRSIQPLPVSVAPGRHVLGSLERRYGEIWCFQSWKGSNQLGLAVEVEKHVSQGTPPPTPTFWHFFGPIAHRLDFRVGRVIHSLKSIMWFQSIWRTWIKLQKSSPTRAKGVKIKKDVETNLVGIVKKIRTQIHSVLTFTWKPWNPGFHPPFTWTQVPPCLGTRTPGHNKLTSTPSKFAALNGN